MTSSLVTVYVRGNLISVSVTPKDAQGAPTSPESVTWSISYPSSASARTIADIDLVADTADEWTGSWDSSVAFKGRVFWAVRAVSPAAAEEGFFDLEANDANADPS